MVLVSWLFFFLRMYYKKFCFFTGVFLEVGRDFKVLWLFWVLRWFCWCGWLFCCLFLFGSRFIVVGICFLVFFYCLLLGIFFIWILRIFLSFLLG